MFRFATIGTGRIVEQFLQGAAHEPRFEWEVCYSRTQESAQSFIERVFDSTPLLRGKPRIITSLEQLAEDASVDAVYVASPNSFHTPQTLAMLDGGKHVLCEKPFAANTQQAQIMIERAKGKTTKQGQPIALMEAMKTTLLPNFEQVRKALPRIGTIRRYFAQFCQYSSRYDSFKNGIVANVFDPAKNGGSLLDLGVYGIAPMVHLFGLPSGPEEIQNCISTQHYQLSSGVDGMGTLLVQYGEAATKVPSAEFLATIVHSKISASALPTEIQGEQGAIVIDKLSTMIHPHLILRDGTQEDLSVPTCADDMYYEIHEFCNLIESGRAQSDINSWDRTLDVMRICDAAKNQ